IPSSVAVIAAGTDLDTTCASGLGSLYPTTNRPRIPRPLWHRWEQRTGRRERRKCDALPIRVSIEEGLVFPRELFDSFCVVFGQFAHRLSTVTDSRAIEIRPTVVFYRRIIGVSMLPIQLAEL